MCEPNQKHFLQISVDKQAILTIKFPHRSCAYAFATYINSQTYHRLYQCAITENLEAKLQMPPLVDWKWCRDRKGLTFTFCDAPSAKDWRENSALWEPTPQDVCLYIPVEWTTEKLEICGLEVYTELETADMVQPHSNNNVDTCCQATTSSRRGYPGPTSTWHLP